MGHFLDALGDNVDIIKIGDDLGTQESLLMSPVMYRRCSSRSTPTTSGLHPASGPSAKIFFHTDGDVFPLIDDLVEIGVDILNPIQTSAGKMSDLSR